MAARDIADPGTVGMSATRLECIEPGLRPFIDSGALAGYAVAVARRGEVVHRSAAGHRDREAETAMTEDTIFRIYSMTKPIVSTALMLLHEEGRFLLDQPLAAYLPGFATVQVMNADGSLEAPAHPPTIAEALSHTSGLTYDFMIDNPVADLYREHRIMNDATRTLAEVIDAVAELPLAFQPGSRWHYSVGIDVAARLIEVLTDQPVGDVLEERIFGPLGMSDTGFGVADGDDDRLAAMYGLPDLVGQNYSAVQLVEAAMSGFNERLDVSATYPTKTPDVYQRGGVGLFSTLDDYLRFARMLAAGGVHDGERIVGRKTLELMHANRVPAELLPFEIMGMPTPGYGFGLGSRVMLDVAASGRTGSVGEFGWAGAAKTYFWVDPVEDLVGVFMSQYMTGPLNPDATFRNLVYQAIDD